ncbi:MAG: PucR family transcriptional regulator ligand-binding domain-containing protein [Candidatus Pristimantibacillus lignocellulolyticus]|uniref:PucR family transcriptional regulator ligand-binding domain-containing protein n=1 Tax=Candidatus Pristimantibacillus lignocellulolyticus TaxID=2994561 RepID=A0A9J6ZI83_9BACL|nr:MAG: PucR family transcriptional regulator ligand-binding domain-containing protein [Candidatus Pristimantibacillus lignocellulolyticus]
METIQQELFTVHSLFEVPDLKEAILLGGHTGLDNVITRVNVMEVPDVVDWVRAGELLMTTGYPFKDRPERLALLVEQLATKGVAALGIKTKRFFDSVPQEVIDAANRCGLPLIELPPSTTFSDLVREIMERVLVSEAKDLMILQSRVQRLSHLLLHGDGLISFLKHLYIMINNPVILIDQDQTVIVPQELEAWYGKVNEQELEKWYSSERMETNVLHIGEEAFHAHSMIVPGEFQQSYRLVIIEQYSPYSTVDALTVNWASRLLGFEISNMQARKKIEAKYSDQFVQDWLSGRMVSNVDIHLRAEACGWELDHTSTYMVGVVSFWEEHPNVKELQEMVRSLRWDAELQQGVRLMWIILEGELTFLLSQSGARWSKEQRNTFLQGINNVVKSVLHEKKATLCLSRVVEQATEVAGAYREAKRVMEIRKVHLTQSEIYHYSQLGVYLLLYRMQDTEEMEEFKQLYLYPLLVLERKQQGTLLTTLSTYFECNCNAKETAERLYVHYNTVNYRLERISHELGFKLDNPEIKLLLQLAIKVYHLHG